MELVYKKDGFINKLFACLFIAMFIVMFLVGSNVFAFSYHDKTIDNNINFPDWIKKYNYYFFTSKASDGFYDFQMFCYTGDCYLKDLGSRYGIYLNNNSKYYTFSLRDKSIDNFISKIENLVEPNFNVLSSSSSTPSLVGALEYNSLSQDSAFISSILYDFNNHDDIIYNATSIEERGATGDVEYDSYINGLIGSNGGNLSDIASDITNGDIGNSVENSDKTSIFNISQKLGSGFSKIFSFFNFIDTVKNSIVDIYNLLINTTEAPKLYMTFNHQYIQGEQCILDLSWYSPYKEFGDNVICAFMYACFMWHVFKNLYNIISGENSSIEDVSSSN